jgi:hypothetical protein
MRECPRSGNGMDRDCCNKRTSWIDKHGVILKADQAPPDVATIGGKHCRGCETALYGSKPFADGIERLLDNVPQWVGPSTLSPQIILWLPSVLYARKPQRISQASPGVPEPLFSATQAGSYSSCCLRSSSVTPYLSRGELEAAEVIHFAAEPVAPRSQQANPLGVRTTT